MIDTSTPARCYCCCCCCCCWRYWNNVSDNGQTLFSHSVAPPLRVNDRSDVDSDPFQDISALFERTRVFSTLHTDAGTDTPPLLPHPSPSISNCTGWNSSVDLDPLCKHFHLHLHLHHFLLDHETPSCSTPSTSFGWPWWWLYILIDFCVALFICWLEIPSSMLNCFRMILFCWRWIFRELFLWLSLPRVASTLRSAWSHLNSFELIWIHLNWFDIFIYPNCFFPGFLCVHFLPPSLFSRLFPHPHPHLHFHYTFVIVVIVPSF